MIFHVFKKLVKDIQANDVFYSQIDDRLDNKSIDQNDCLYSIESQKTIDPEVNERALLTLNVFESTIRRFQATTSRLYRIPHDRLPCFIIQINCFFVVASVISRADHLL